MFRSDSKKYPFLSQTFWILGVKMLTILRALLYAELYEERKEFV